MEERRFDNKRFRRHSLPDDWIAISGRTAEDNDVLSIRLCEAKDYWFHALGCPGSHVILLHREDTEPSRELLEVAAAIAAWHSKARGNPVAKVGMTRGAHVSKMKGSPAGQVMVKHEKVLKVTPGLPES